MSSDSPTPEGDAQEPRLSWRDRELLAALRRLANAQVQLQTLEAAAAVQGELAATDPGDPQRVEALEAELVKLRAKAGSRFGGGSARERLPDVEMEQRLILERLGYDSYAAFEAGGGRPRAPVAALDAGLVEFARHELAAAEEAYAQILALPDEDPGDHDGDAVDDDPAEAPPPRHPTIDLRRGETA
jgi:hypothetical protein